ncbi:hypothetical protein N9E35_00265 [Candidatus Marinimicrobia bacterium]|nr:hypothetical protein [Candidatus Neomarinimicrobiota bacterium]
MLNKKGNSISFGVWFQYVNRSEKKWRTYFQKYKNSGIINYFIQGTPSQLKKIIIITKSMEINIHAWVWALNRPKDEVAMNNLDWYSVNREGRNSYDSRPYVDYYQWLSPFSPGARKHIKKNIKEFSELDGLASVHLDYVRYCDVILPIALQPKYNLVQKDEMPQYDFGYHKEARREYKEIYNVDPIKIEDPQRDNNWLKFRLDALTSLVNQLVEIAHKNGTKLSAAVFPFPEMSRRMVRQDWSSWNLDIVCPMNYHHFYNKDLDWIKFSVEQGIKEIGTEVEYYSGLFVGSLPPVELKEAIIKSINGGATGVNFFSIKNLTEKHLKIIKSV